MSEQLLSFPAVEWLLQIANYQSLTPKTAVAIANYRRPDPQPKASGNRRHLGINPKFGLENESFRIPHSAIRNREGHQP